jgi:hypothetical protein
MSVLLVIVSFVVAFIAFGFLLGAKSAIHEIEAFVLFLIASVFFVGGCLLGSVNNVLKELKKGAGGEPGAP